MSMTFYGLTLKSMKISSESQGAVSTAVIICFSPTRCKPSMHSFWKRKKICPFLDSTTHIHYSSLWIHIIRYNHSFTGQVQMTSVDEAHKFVTKNHAFTSVLKGKNTCTDDDCLHWYTGMFYKDNKSEVQSASSRLHLSMHWSPKTQVIYPLSCCYQ